jgi:hypothetical protein
MTSKKITLDGSSHKQLIDLNGEAVNFKLEFVITPGESDKDKPYAISIITQDKLDANDDIQLSTVKGQFRKTLSNISGNYQNFCLIINSAKGVKFTEPLQIDIQLDDIGVREVQPRKEPRQMQESFQPTPTAKPAPEAQAGNKKMKYIVGGLIIIVGACLLYYFWTQSKKKDAGVIVPTVSAPTVVAETPSVVIEEVSLPKPSIGVSKPTFSFY